MADRNELFTQSDRDPNVCPGWPVIWETRIWLSLIVDNLAVGVAELELLAAYPQLLPDDVCAAVAYAAQ